MRVWYASYGSNVSRDRFLTYLRGGSPHGARRTYPGARDRSDPSDDRAFTMPGRLRFGWESPTWGGGIAFYDAAAQGTVLARAYLLTHEQFVDVAAQEMHREPGADLDLTQVLEHRRHDAGPGRYESLHLVGELDRMPVVTFTAPDPSVLGTNAPAPAYLATIAAGLQDAHGLDDDGVVDYLLGCAGVTPEWTAHDLYAVVRRGAAA